MANVKRDIKRLNNRSIEEDIAYRALRILNASWCKPLKEVLNITVGVAVGVLVAIEKRLVVNKSL